mmetsp:Transcript_33884/g.97640  ORF Transcript_33884/g.97640 Transcript_33884/m.97640 type:complete len:163 (+) Transcript_33884:28-516(+)
MACAAELWAGANMLSCLLPAVFIHSSWSSKMPSFLPHRSVTATGRHRKVPPIRRPRRRRTLRAADSSTPADNESLPVRQIPRVRSSRPPPLVSAPSWTTRERASRIAKDLLKAGGRWLRPDEQESLYRAVLVDVTVSAWHQMHRSYRLEDVFAEWRVRGASA